MRLTVKHVRIGAIIGMVIYLGVFSWIKANDPPAPTAYELFQDAHEEYERTNEGDAGKESDADTAKPPPPVAPASAPRSTPSPTPLPFFAVPTEPVIDELLARAHAGDSRAACRLGKTLSNCRNPVLRSYGSMTDEQVATWGALDTGSTEQREQKLQRFLATRQRAIEFNEGCKSVPFALTADAPKYALQAAQAGNVNSMLQIAQGPLMATANDFIFNPSLAHLYQQHAMPMLVRALEAGSPDAGSILAMLTGYSDAQHLVEQLPPFLRSPETAAALHRMIVQRIDPTSNVLGQDPPSSEASAAAQQLYDQYFANSRRWQESSLAARIAAPTMFGGIDAGFMDDDCEKPW